MGPWPLSLQQQRHLDGERARGRRPENIVAVFRLLAPPDPSRFRDAFAEQVRLHPLLRARVVERPGAAELRIADDDQVPLSVYTDEPERSVDALLARHRGTVFDRALGPCWSALILRGTDGVRYLSLAFDHLIWDGMSLDSFLAGVCGAAPADGELRPYGEFVRWQASTFTDCGASGLDHWRRTLEGTAVNRPVDLPYCLSPTGPISGHTLVEDAWVGADAAAALTVRCARARTTRFVYVLAAFLSVLARASGQCDLSVKVSVHGRPPGYERTVGWFANDVVLRVRDAGGGRDLTLPRVRAAWLDALEHQLVPYPLVLRCVEPERRITDHRPATVGCNARTVPLRLDALGTPMVLRSMSGGAERQGIHLDVVQWGEDLLLRCAFDRARFRGADIAGLLRQLVDELLPDTV